MLGTPVLDEPVTVIFSKNGLCARQGHGVDPATLAFKEGDDPRRCFPAAPWTR